MTGDRSALPALLLTLLVFAACTPPPVKRDGPAKEARLAALSAAPRAASRPAAAKEKSRAPATDEDIAAFRDYVHAYYNYALYEQEQEKAKGEDEARLKELKRGQLASGKLLKRRLGLPDDASAGRLVKEVRRRINLRSDIEVLPDIWGARVASVCVVRLRPGASRRGEVTLFGEDRATDVRVFDAVLIEDFVSYRRRKRKLPAAFQGVLVAGPVFYIDGRAVGALARSGFWTRLDYYRSVERAAREPKTFTALEGKAGRLLSLVKDALRWRALSPLAYKYESRPEALQVERFVEDFIARAELRAAAELREIELFSAARGRRPETPAERRLIAERAQLSAVIHGEPLGATADIFGLAARGLSQAEDGAGPNLRAASNLAREMLAGVRGPGPVKPGDEGRALYRISRGDPAELRAVALTAYRKRSGE